MKKQFIKWTGTEGELHKEKKLIRDHCNMKKIFKYELSIKEKQELLLPVGSQILRVDDVDGKFFLWAIVDDPEESEEAVELTPRYIEFYKTGQELKDPAHLFYLGFCKLFIMQELGLYVFERFH